MCRVVTYEHKCGHRKPTEQKSLCIDKCLVGLGEEIILPEPYCCLEGCCQIKGPACSNLEYLKTFRYQRGTNESLEKQIRDTQVEANIETLAHSTCGLWRKTMGLQLSVHNLMIISIADGRHAKEVNNLFEKHPEFANIVKSTGHAVNPVNSVQQAVMAKPENVNGPAYPSGNQLNSISGTQLATSYGERSRSSTRFNSPRNHANHLIRKSISKVLPRTALKIPLLVKAALLVPRAWFAVHLFKTTHARQAALSVAMVQLQARNRL